MKSFSLNLYSSRDFSSERILPWGSVRNSNARYDTATYQRRWAFVERQRAHVHSRSLFLDLQQFRSVRHRSALGQCEEVDIYASVSMHTDLEDLLLQSFYGYLHLVTVVSELKSKGKVDRRKERRWRGAGQDSEDPNPGDLRVRSLYGLVSKH